MFGLNSAGLAWALASSLGAVALLALGLCVWLIADQRRQRAQLSALEAERAKLADRLERIGRAQAEMEAASEAKSRFLATVSHEIRTPLNGVLGMADLMLDTRLDPEQANYARAIKTSGEALLTLIEEILDFSRIEAGNWISPRRRWKSRPLLEGVIELLAPRAQGKGLEIAAHLASDVPPVIRADGSRLRQIVTNLAGNAVKFTEKGGVGLTLARHGEHGLAIRIEDTGPAFRRTGRKRFSPNSNKPIAKPPPAMAVRVSGSPFRAASRGSWAGISRLKAWKGRLGLHLAVAAGSRGGPAAAEPEIARELAGRKVLVVSAGAFEGRFIARHLAEIEAETRHAASHAEALALLKSFAPDLMMVDAAIGPRMPARWLRRVSKPVAAVISFCCRPSSAALWRAAGRGVRSVSREARAAPFADGAAHGLGTGCAEPHHLRRERDLAGRAARGASRAHCRG